MSREEETYQTSPIVMYDLEPAAFKRHKPDSCVIGWQTQEDTVTPDHVFALLGYVTD